MSRDMSDKMRYEKRGEEMRWFQMFEMENVLTYTWEKRLSGRRDENWEIKYFDDEIWWDMRCESKKRWVKGQNEIKWD